MSDRLYMAVHVHNEPESELEDWERELLACHTRVVEPAGWREFAIARGFVDEDGVPDAFFWPKTNVPYKSRSTAQKRVDIINYWGGHAVVVECTPVWETVEAANARREAERFQARIVRKQEELAVLTRQRDVALGYEGVGA